MSPHATFLVIGLAVGTCGGLVLGYVAGRASGLREARALLGPVIGGRRQ